MNNAIFLDANDVRKILAQKYGVPEKNVIKAQYSYTIILVENTPRSGDGEPATSES